MNDTDIVILDSARTATGSFNGALSGIPAHHLGALVIKELLRRNNIDSVDIDDVIIGQVLTAGCGQNPARQTVIASGLSESVPALTINKVCGSGLKSIQLAFLAIRNGDADLVIAGGQENMSIAPHILPNSRNGARIGDWMMQDTLIKDGLLDAFNHYHMGVTAENIAEKYKISRQEQDEFALASQQKTKKAWEKHYFTREIIPIEVTHNKKKYLFQEDEFPRPQTTLEDLAKLRPAFKKTGSVTAGNSSGINDGAAMVILTTGKKAKKLGIRPLAKIVEFATAAVSPQIMGTGPIIATHKVLKNSSWNIKDLDLIESNEAFSSQAICVNREIGWDLSKVNVNGGAIALGHPIGSSGTRIVVTLIHEMMRREVNKGLATLCIGGGMGIAVTVERV